MKRLIISLFCLTSCLSVFSQKEIDKPFLPQYYFPQFPGKTEQLERFLSDNIKYPISALEKKKSGKVVANFIVNRAGEIKDIKIVQSLDSVCDKEVLRVLRSMPKWIPGKANGITLSSLFVIPFHFRIYGDSIRDNKPCKEIYYTPSFTGGISEFEKYLTENIKFPETETKDIYAGNVRVSFNISEQGMAKNIKMRYNTNDTFGDEVLQVLSSMPLWKSNQSDGINLDIEWLLNVSFWIDEKYTSCNVMASDINIDNLSINDCATIDISEDTKLSFKIQQLNPIVITGFSESKP